MRATVHDASGPWWTRGALVALGGAVAAAGIAWSPWLYGAGLALIVLASAIRGRFAPCAAEVSAAPGRVEIRSAGPLNQTIRAKEVRGASAARYGDGLTLALMRSTRDEPTLIDVRDQAELTQLCDALGIGRNGRGVLAFPVRKRVRLPTAIVFGVAAALVTSFAMLVFAILDFPPGPTFETIFAVLWPAFLYASRRDGASWLELHPGGVFAPAANGMRAAVPYGAISGAEVLDEHLVISRFDDAPVAVPLDWVARSRRGVTRGDALHIAAQLEAAAQRARGALPPAPTVHASSLARLPGEPTRAWLERLESTAQQIKLGASYRGSALSEAELWTALEDHDADPLVRAACARVLTRIGGAGARARIEAVLAAVYADRDQRRIRVALDHDVERASAELEELEDVALARRA